MSSIDEREWLSDEVWAQVRPRRARFRKTISVAITVVVVGAVVLSQIGFFHPRVAAFDSAATVRGNRLIVVLTLENGAQVPVRVTGLRATQPGARVVSTRFDGTFPLALDNPPADGARVTPFTVHAGHSESLTIVYVLDCAKLRLPLRVNFGTHSLFGNQTSTSTLYSSTTAPLKQVCPGTASSLSG